MATKEPKLKRVGLEALRTLRSGAAEAAWLTAAGLAIGAKGGLLAKSMSGPLASRLRGFGLVEAARKVERLRGVSAGRAMLEGMKTVSHPFRALPAREKALVAGLGLVPGMVHHLVKEVPTTTKVGSLVKEAPFKSQAQRRLFYAKASRGEIAQKTVEEWERHTPKSKKLPERVKRAFYGELVGITGS